MKERFERLMEGRCLRGQVSFGTFHAVFFRILKLAYGYEAADIIREDQRLRFMRELVAKEQLEPEDENELIASLLSEISSVKGELIDLDTIMQRAARRRPSSESMQAMRRDSEETERSTLMTCL